MRSKKPTIGITISGANASDKYRWPAKKEFDFLKREYYQAIIKSGGLPILLPNAENRDIIKSYLESIDGLLLTGGGDLHPRYFGQKAHEKLSRTYKARDYFEMAIAELALKMGMPIMAICRGHQVLNVVLGGTLYQDLSCIPHKTLAHADPDQTARNFHSVKIVKGSNLHKIIGSLSIQVNSSHHQVIDRLGRGLIASAFAPDGLIEAIELPGAEFVLSLQWHPEGIFNRAHSKRLFRAFVNKSREK